MSWVFCIAGLNWNPLIWSLPNSKFYFRKFFLVSLCSSQNRNFLDTDLWLFLIKFKFRNGKTWNKCSVIECFFYFYYYYEYLDIHWYVRSSSTYMLHTSVILENSEDNVQNIYMPRFPRCLDPKFFRTKGFATYFPVAFLCDVQLLTKWIDISDF